MHLLDLPTELVVLIIFETIPDGFESFALSCKTILEISRPFFARHELAKQYQTFSYQKRVRSVEGWIIRTPHQLLYEIARRPEIANIIIWADLRAPLTDTYPDVPLDFGAVGDGWDNWVWSQPKDELSLVLHQASASLLAGWDMDVPEVVQGILRDIGYFGDFYGQYTPSSAAFMSDATTPAFERATVALVALLPNLRSLTTSKGPVLSDREDETHSIVQSLIDCSNASVSDCRAQRPLQSLREVHPSWPRGNNMEYLVSDFESILTLKSLEVFVQASCIAMKEVMFSPLQLSPQSHFPGVRELVLWASVVGPNEIYELASRMPRLEICRLEQTTARSEEECTAGPGCPTCDQEWEVFDPGRIAKSLMRAAGGTLRGLGLTIDFNVGSCVTAIGDLKGFEKLEELEVSCNAFFADWVDSMTEEEKREEIRAQVPRLIDILPPTLKRLRLKTANDVVSAEKRRHGLGRLLRDFSEAVATLSVLEVVEIVPEPEVEVEGESDDEEGERGVDGDDKKAFPENFYDKDILDLVASLDRVCFRKSPGFKFMTLQRGPPSWFQSGGYGT